MSYSSKYVRSTSKCTVSQENMNCKYKQKQRETKLENVAINDVLPLKAARRDAVANVKSFWGSGTQPTKFRWLHLHSLCDATLLGSHQGHLPRYV